LTPAPRDSLPVGAPLTIALGVLAVVAGAAGSHLSTVVFAACAALLAVVVAYASLSWPRPALVLVAISPILDRYLAPGILAPEVEGIAHFLSEGMLLTVGLALTAQAARRGTLRAAIWHPTSAFVLAFGLAAVASALVNAVPPVQAVVGVAFTLDAVAFFYLARIVGFDVRQAMIAIGAFIGLLSVAALVALGQAVLTPELFGLYALQGRFGEVYRLASFFGDPNVFAALLSASVPFLLFGVPGLRTRRGRSWAFALAALLVLALWLSFSRGGWLGAVVGFGLAAAILDRRALAIGVVLGAATFAVAWVMPRDLLGGAGQRPDLLRSTWGRVDTIGGGRDLRILFVINSLPIIADHPVLGVGPGKYGGAAADLFGTDVYAEYETDELFINPAQRTVDNFWLHLLVETGVIGLVAFAGMVGVPLVQVIRGAMAALWARRVLLSGIAAAVIALSVNGLTTMLLEANSVAFLFWFLLGIGSVLAPQPTGERSNDQVARMTANRPSAAETSQSSNATVRWESPSSSRRWWMWRRSATKTGSPPTSLRTTVHAVSASGRPSATSGTQGATAGEPIWVKLIAAAARR
jgi:putative inorganic carbon (HCO3(-)) transporter